MQVSIHVHNVTNDMVCYNNITNVGMFDGKSDFIKINFIINHSLAC